MKVTCPTCKIVTEWEGNDYRPFCSERCKLIDLGRWASEKYRILLKTDAGEDPNHEDGEESLPRDENGNAQG